MRDVLRAIVVGRGIRERIRLQLLFVRARSSD
jgi:hypothetical protein